MDPRDRFTATAADYRQHRPDYPDELIDWLCQDASLRAGSVVVDVGCGTGISSRQLAARGLTVIGVDPNEAMLEAARSADGPVEYRRGDGESLPIEGPVDAIVGGQSFHWLDLDRALPDFARVLRPGGRVVPFWNLRDPTDPMMARYEELLVAHCPEYVTVGAEPRARAILARSDLLDKRSVTFSHAQYLDRTAFLGRVWSSSYVKHGVVDRLAFEAAIGALFDEHAVAGEVAFKYRSVGLGFSPG